MSGRILRRWTPVVVALVVAGGLTTVTAPAEASPVAAAAAAAVPAVRLPQLTVDPTAAKRIAAGGTGVLRFPIRLLRPASTVVTVRYATDDGSAVAGADYTAATGTATIAAGATTTSVAVRVTAGALAKSRHLRLVLTRPSGARLENDNALGTILADAWTTPQVDVGDAAGYRRIATAGAVVFPVLLSAPTTGAVAVHCATRDQTATAADHDYTPVDTTVTVPAGATRTTVTVVLPNRYDHTGANFVLQCTSPTGTPPGPSLATGSILPGVEPALAWAVESTVVVGDPTGQVAHVPVYELGPLAGSVPMHFSWRYDIPKAGGPYGFDIPAGQTSTTIAVPVSDSWCTGAPGDTPCGIRVLGGGPKIGYHPEQTGSTQYQAGITIVRDPSVAADFVDPPHSTLVEVGDTYRVPATLDVPASGAQFSWTTVDGSAVAGRDYVAASGTFTADGSPGPTIDVLPGSRQLSGLTFTVRFTPVAPAVLPPGDSGDATVVIHPLDTFRPTGTIHESSGEPLPAGLQVFFDTYPTQTQVPVDAAGNFALAGFTPLAATGHVVVPAGWTGDQTFSIPTGAGPGHVDLTITAPA